MWNKESMINLALVMPADDASVYLEVVQFIGTFGENESSFLIIYTPRTEGAVRTFEFTELPDVVDICKRCKDVIVFSCDKYAIRMYR